MAQRNPSTDPPREVAEALEVLAANPEAARASGIFDPWRLDDILENQVVPEIQAIRALLDAGQPPVDGPGDIPGEGTGAISELLEEIRENTRMVVEPEVGLVGTTLEAISEGDEGLAVFERNGTRFASEITATAEVDQFETVELIAEPDVARPNPALRGVDRDPELRVAPGGVINIETQTWSVDGLQPLTSSVEQNTFGTALTAGGEAVVVEASSSRQEIAMDIMAMGSSLHKADIDGDGSAESPIRYHYEYQDEPRGDWQAIHGLTGVWPRGSISNPLAPTEETFVGPVYGFRIRYENLSDEAGLVASSVPADNLRSVLHGRAFQAASAGL